MPVGSPQPVIWIGRGLAREDQQALPYHVAGEIDQDVDVVPADLFGHRLVGHAGGFAPMVGALAQPDGQFVFQGGVGIAEDFEPRLVMMGEYVAAGVNRGVTAEIGADISDAQPPFRVGIAEMRRRSGRVAFAMRLPPAPAFRLLLLGPDSRVEVQIKDQVGMRRGIAGVERQRLAQTGDRLADIAALGQHIAEIDQRFGEARFERERTAKRRFRLRRLALLAQHQAEIVVSLGVIGLERDRPAIGVDGG